MGGWMGQSADLLKPLYGSLKEVLFQSKECVLSARVYLFSGGEQFASSNFEDLWGFRMRQR
jgi:hypothetical protein